MAKNQVTGQARIKIDGDLLDSDGSATLEIGGAKRESVTGDYSAGAFKESTEPSKLEVTVLNKGDTQIAAYRKITAATVTVEFDNGQSWLIPSGYCADTITLNQADGKAKLVFMGEPAEQL